MYKSPISIFMALLLLGGACDQDEPIDALDDDVDALSDDEGLDRVPAEFPAFDLEDVDARIEAVADSATRVRFEAGTESPSARDDARELQLRFAHALTNARPPDYFTTRSADDEVIEITFLGKGRVAPVDDTLAATDDQVPDSEPTAEADIEVPERYSDGARWIVGFNGETQHEFEVRIPAELADIVGSDAQARGIDRGAPGSEELTFRGIVGPNDTRVLKGQQNTAQTSSNLRRIVGFVNAGSSATASSQCTGTLVGRHHVVSAAHCIYERVKNGNPAFWKQPGMRVGRNGNDWIAGANTSTGSRWFWIEAAYKSSADQGGSPAAWDFGLIITPTRHIGDSTGWFGWQYSNSSHDDMYNRGYPFTPPLSGFGGHMFGDSNQCNTGDFSSQDDSQGYSLVGYHSCDTTGGQSGSPLYRQDGDGDWVVRGVHKGAGNPNSSTANDGNLWNSFALVTRDRSDTIAYFRALWP